MHHLQRLAVLSELCILKMQNSLLLNTPIAWADKLKGAYLHSSIVAALNLRNDGAAVSYSAIGRLHQSGESRPHWWLARSPRLSWSESQLFLWQHAVVKPGPYGGAVEAIPPLLAGVSWGWEAPLQEVGLPVWNECVCMRACVHMCWLFEIKCDFFLLLENEMYQRPLKRSKSRTYVLCIMWPERKAILLQFWAFSDI